MSMAFSLFERAWSLRGMTDLMIDMLEAPEFVDELFDAITDYNCGVLEEVLRYDIDCVRLGDDWGQQNGLIFGGRLWRRFIKPRLARMYGMVKRAGKAVMIHSCGRVQELFPELIELGLDIFNPFHGSNGKPIVFLIHPNEFINEVFEGKKIARRSSNYLSYLLRDVIRRELKLKNLGVKALPLYKREIEYFNSRGFEFVTCKQYYNNHIKKN